MKACVSVPVLCSLALVACGSGSGSGRALSSFRPAVTHPYFPIAPGERWIYEGEHLGQPRREEVRALEQPRVIAGVTCTAVLQEVFVDGALTELATDWFAQDSLGNVWKFGEENFERHDGQLVLMPDSWLATTDDARQWIAFPAVMQQGDAFSGYRPDGVDHFVVASLSASAITPAGAFEGCLEIHEDPDDPNDADIILYAPGVGRVSESDPAGRIELVAR